MDPTPAEREFWRKYRQELVVQAKKGMTSEEVLKILHTPGLAWS